MDRTVAIDQQTHVSRPSVTVCYAQTLDGRLATRTGSSQWISGPESLEFVHRLRAEHDAIMVGVGTVLADNPRLTVRLVDGRDPLRIVVDSALRTPLDAAVLVRNAARGTILAVTGRAPEERLRAASARGATVVTCDATTEGQVDLRSLLAHLHERDIGSVMVEGGAQLITALLQQRLVDRMVVTIAPKVLGSGIDAVGDLGISALADAYRLEPVRVRQYGADLVLDGQLVYPERAGRTTAEVTDV